MINKFYRLNNVQDITGLSISTIWRMEQENRFPKRRKIGARAVGWLESEIQEWLKNKQGENNA